MKITTIILVITCSAILNFRSYAQNDATKQETADFLISKFRLDDNTVLPDNSQENEDMFFKGRYPKYKEENVTINDCDCTISYHTLYAWKDRQGYPWEKRTIKFSFSDLKEAATDLSGRYRIPSDYNKEVVRSKIYAKSEDVAYLDDDGKQYFNEWSFMWSANKQLCERVTNALNHMIKLCQKKEKF